MWHHCLLLLPCIALCFMHPRQEMDNPNTCCVLVLFGTKRSMLAMRLSLHEAQS